MTTALKIDRLVDNIHNTSITYPDATFSEKGKVYTCLNPYSYHIPVSYTHLTLPTI